MTARRVGAAALFVLLLLPIGGAGAEEEALRPDADARLAAATERLTRAYAEIDRLEKALAEARGRLAVLAGPEAERRDRYQQQYYDYLSERLNLTLAGYRWNARASEFVLWLVVMVVTAGLAFSGFQLWNAARAGRPQETTELELSADRVRVTSSVVGIVVLVISIVFLYLFVREIYGIEVLDPERAPPAAESTAPK